MDALALATDLAAEQAGVLSRRQAYRLGVTRWQLTAQLRAKRWQRLGSQTVAVHTGPLSDEATWWKAVLEVGPRAAVDGVTALLAAGLKGFDADAVHVIVPKSAEPRFCFGVVVHESRRFRESDVVTTGLRRMRSAVAAVHAALWAVSDRQAALLLVMVVQQRIAPAEQIAEALDAVRRHGRRRLLRQLLTDLADGSHALGELDVLAGLRRRGLPEPVRQSVRRTAAGKIYLDIEWPDWRLILEVDGSHHDDAAQRLADTLRDLELTAGGDTVLRVPLLAWRLDEEAVLDRLEAVFAARGWSRAAAAA